MNQESTTTSIGTSPRLLRVIGAALRLAAIYALGVLLLLVPFLLWAGAWDGAARELLTLQGFVVAIALGLAFLLLAVARQLGLAALWFLLAGLWAWWLAPLRNEWSPISVLVGFVLWSILALPLYVLGAIAIPSAPILHVQRVQVTGPALILGPWVLLLVVTFVVTPGVYFTIGSAMTGIFHRPPSMVLALTPFLWAPAPMLIAGDALLRLRHTARLRDGLGDAAA